MKDPALLTTRPTRLTRLSAILAVLCVGVGSLPAADLVWSNTATITVPPQIDAITFINSGLIEVATQLPFETSDTRNYTNSGGMFGSDGWFFDNAAPDVGKRVPSDNFVNLNQGVIQAMDGSGGGFVSTNFTGSGISPSYLWISASNVVSKGTLRVGSDGWLKINGTNVDLARSALDVLPLTGNGSSNGATNFSPDLAITGLWWGTSNAIAINYANIYNGTVATAPRHAVLFPNAVNPVGETFSVFNPLAFGYSNSLGSASITLTNTDGSTTNVMMVTNMVKQAVFVGLGDPSLTASVTFTPSTQATNNYQTVAVQLGMVSTNVITQLPETNFLYFFDTLASETPRGLLTTLGGAAGGAIEARPANYILSRVDNGTFAGGAPGNVTPDATFLYDPATFTNAVVVGDYAGYAAFIDNIAVQPPVVNGGYVTNLPGRIDIVAENLDMRFTRMRGQGEVAIQATHLIGSGGAALDSPNLSFSLGATTNGALHLANLTKATVSRLKGDLLAWSAVWNNQMNVVLTNNFDTNGVSVPLTNAVNVQLYALILDAENLAAQIPVFTWNLELLGTNSVIDDSLNLVQIFFVDGQSLTINGAFALTSYNLATGGAVTGVGSTIASLTDWVSTNTPNLLFFTNTGSINIPNSMHLGDDRPTPLQGVVNTGTISAGSLYINSAYVENDGTIFARLGPLTLAGGIGNFEGGETASGGDLSLTFSDLKFLNHRIVTTGSLNFSATDALTDAGTGSSNTFTTENGFSLLVKPNTGDLLGTTVLDSPPPFVEVDHVWAGNDRGATASGFQNNVALGDLVLNSSDTDPARAPLFFFTGTNGQSGLYVDVFDISSLGSNYTSMIEIDPSITIYFASAILGFTPPPNSSGISQTPEEFLNGQFGGHLVWVSSFAGPASSTAVVVNGQTVEVNSALLNSKIIDSDGDGIPNFYDSTPFGPGSSSAASGTLIGLGLLNRPSPSQQVFSLNFNAQANTAYRVEVTTNLASPNWQLVTSYTNSSPATANVTIADTNNINGKQRFYRVRLAQ